MCGSEIKCPSVQGRKIETVVEERFGNFLESNLKSEFVFFSEQGGLCVMMVIWEKREKEDIK